MGWAMVMLSATAPMLQPAGAIRRTDEVTATGMRLRPIYARLGDDERFFDMAMKCR